MTEPNSKITPNSADEIAATRAKQAILSEFHKGVWASTNPSNDGKGTITRPAIPIDYMDGTSLDFIDHNGHLAFRLNVFDNTREEGATLPRFTVDVCVLDERLHGRFQALHKGVPVVNVVPPEGVQVYTVTVKPKDINAY